MATSVKLAKKRIEAYVNMTVPHFIMVSVMSVFKNSSICFIARELESQLKTNLN